MSASHAGVSTQSKAGGAAAQIDAGRCMRDRRMPQCSVSIRTRARWALCAHKARQLGRDEAGRGGEAQRWLDADGGAVCSTAHGQASLPPCCKSTTWYDAVWPKQPASTKRPRRARRRRRCCCCRARCLLRLSVGSKVSTLLGCQSYQDGSG